MSDSILQALQFGPFPGAQSVFVWDNCAISMMKKSVSSLWVSVVSEVLYIMQLHTLTTFAGAKLNYLSPYLPDFNLIEQTFHLIKAWLQWHELEVAQPEVHL